MSYAVPRDFSSSLQELSVAFLNLSLPSGLNQNIFIFHHYVRAKTKYIKNNQKWGKSYI